MNLFKRLNQSNSGDTIVEVLIAVAIVGSVLTGAFAISNRSLQQVRMAQEQTEAQKIASSQVERLNRFVIDNPNYLNFPLPSPSTFCITQDNVTGEYQASSTSVASPSTNCRSGIENRYSVTVSGITDAAFRVQVNWDGLNGNPQNVTFTYRVKTPENP